MSDTTGFSRARAEALSERLAEPDWFRRRRLAAAAAYADTPFPSDKAEDWRRVNLGAIDFDSYAVAAPNGTPARGGEPTDAAGLIRAVDGRVTECRLSREATDAGVVLTSLAEAARTHEDLVRRYWMTAAVSPEESKFTLLHAAFVNTGTFLYVPRGVRLTAPIVSRVELTHGGVGSFHHTLAIVEDEAEAELIDESRGGGEGGALSVPVAEVFAGRGARAGYHAVQNWSRGVYEFAVRRLCVGADSAGRLSDLALGGTAGKVFVGAVLEGRGARCDLYGMYFPEAGQQFDYTTLQDHRVPNCVSNLLFKGALANRARSAFRGVIRVHPEAQQTDAYQTNNNLLLGDEARADSMPVLEIEADDVKCSHGATLSSVDAEDLFYLTSRGLPRDLAQRLIIGGFFEPILDQLPSASLRERVQAQVMGRIARQDH